MKGQTRRRLSEWVATLPSFVWLLLLFLLPTLLVFAVTFRPADPYGGIGSGWTLASLLTLVNAHYPAIIWRTIWLSLVATTLCILLATPMGYYMARINPARRRLVLLLVILPFWTSFLVRIFAWKVLLHPEGFIKHLLMFLGLAGQDTSLLYTTQAVLLVMVYTELPFAILPIYAAAEKFDFRLIEAAQDLGATSLKAFVSTFLPGIRVGLMTAFLMVFIPSLGSYVIPDIVGGPTSEMIGNKIAQRTFVDRNLPNAAALSAVLALAVLVPMIAILTLRRKESPRDVLIEEGV
ncbi:MAG: ABC transporter permease [Verrucomicrobiota bacterium]|jgi:spermidine/putrescine transport system permease protein|nr:ABC transporter permease [Verrucomicrobiota bacterium]